MEFGLEERLPIYSGGLGVLAGDHLKAAAELGVPLVGVGLLYRGGYFRQEIDADGRQTEDYQRVDPNAVGLVREPVTVRSSSATRLRGRGLAEGRRLVPLYLLEVELAHGRALQRRPRAPDPPGAAAGRRRRPRAHRARDRAHRLPPERGTLGLPRSSGCASSRRRTETRDALEHVRAHLHLHHAHARSGRQRGIRRRACRPLRGQARRGGRPRRPGSCSTSAASGTSPASA